MELIIYLLLSVYIIYMFNYFKTHYNFALSASKINIKYLFHPVTLSSGPQNMICKFGKDSSWLLASFFIIRYFIKSNNLIRYSTIKTFSTIILIAVFTISLININALIYLIPYFIIEIYYLYIKGV